MQPIILLVAVLVVICAILCGIAVATARTHTGGADSRQSASARSPHVVVDTLNLAHWLGRGDGPVSVAEAVDSTAPTLRKKWPGRIMYVTKDRESSQPTIDSRAAQHAEYAAIAERNRVYLYSVEKYQDPPASSAETNAAIAAAEHTSRGRDDYYTAELARRWKCPVLTEDRMRDFDRFRTAIPPFQVWEFDFARTQPSRDFIRPSDAAPLRRPRAVRFATAGLAQKN